MLSKFSGIIFDMDGLLIDSEPLWFEAEKAILAAVGIPLDKASVLPTRGLRLDEVVDYWYRRRPWNNFSTREVMAQIMDLIIALIKERANLQPGADKVLNICRQLDCKTALVSSSHMKIIEAVLSKFNLNDFDLVYSAEYEKNGKPDPAVYLTACRKLDLDPKKCLVFEDSLNGLMAAKAAGMACVVVPAAEERDDERFKIADFVLNSLEEVDEKIILNLFNNM